MPQSQTHADEVFRQAVEALGEMTTEQLVETVRKAHIRGRPSTNYSCPMAKLLDMQCGVRSNVVGVGKKFIIRRFRTAGNHNREERIKTPKSVVRFLVNFDIGKYPDLFAPPPRAIKAAKSLKRPKQRDYHKGPDRTKSRHRRIKARRNLVELLGGRGFKAED